MSRRKPYRLPDDARSDTLAVRAGQHRTGEGEHAEALFLTSSYVFEDAADAAARFAGDTPGNVYSRYTNPTVRNFEERMAALEAIVTEQRNEDCPLFDIQHLEVDRDLTVVVSLACSKHD